MFCENCGNKLKKEEKFCTKCGCPNTFKLKEEKLRALSDDKWWYRLVKVIYILLYLPLLILIPLVWSENTYSNSYGGSYGEAFWYSLITIVIYIMVIKVIKITFFYITFAQKPQWKKEFKKIF